MSLKKVDYFDRAPLLMFAYSIGEHQQGSMISDLYESRHVRRSKRLYLSSLVHRLACLRNRWVLALFYVTLLYLLYSSVFTVIQSIYR